MSKPHASFIFTGDSFMTKRIPEGGYEGFEDIQKLIASHDVRFNNLEITIHRTEGYPAAYSGGTWAMADPEILDDLKKYSFNLFNTANNHSCDYSHGGLLATIKYLRDRDLCFAGTGQNLADAAAPAYLDTPHARIALIAACSSFHDSDAAGSQSASLPGRPGLNPLRFSTTYHVQEDYFTMLQEVAEKTKMNVEQLREIANGYAHPFPEGKLTMGGLTFLRAEENAMHTAPLEKDMTRILSSIRESKRQADYALVSIHSHQFSGDNMVNPAEFLREFARRCIDEGADAIIGHGPHELRGIEIYHGKPIFYSLGNFIFQTETVRLQPADAYENCQVSADTQVGEYMNMRSKNGTAGYVVQENIWRSVMAGIEFDDDRLLNIRLYPISLGFRVPRSRIGFPILSHDSSVLYYLAELSEPFGTKLHVENGLASVALA